METIYVDDPFFENHVASKPKDQQTSQYCLSQTLHVSQLWHYSGCLWWASSSLSAQALARGHLACWRAQTEGLDLDGLIIYTYSIHQGYIAYIHISLNIPAHNFEDMDIYIYQHGIRLYMYLFSILRLNEVQHADCSPYHVFWPQKMYKRNTFKQYSTILMVSIYNHVLIPFLYMW